MLQQVQVDEKSENSDLNCWELLQAGRIQRLEEVTVKQSEAVSAWRAKCDSFTSCIAEFAKNKDEFGLRYDKTSSIQVTLKATQAKILKQQQEIETARALAEQQRNEESIGYAALVDRIANVEQRFNKDEEARDRAHQHQQILDLTSELSNVKRQLEAERAAKATALGGAHDEAEKWKREAGRVQREYSGLLDAEHKKLAHAEAH